MRAYALMRHANEIEAAYTASPLVARNRDSLATLREALAFEQFASYRGIGRWPLSEDYPEPEPGWQGEKPPALDQEPRARKLLEGFLEPGDHAMHYPRSFVCTLDQARLVRAALRDPDRYELVELCASPDRPREMLGFDVGYWGVGNFSALCDAALWPVWHPPEPEAFPTLAVFLRETNSAALFTTERSAGRYLNWYAAQDWAEKPTEDFSIIAVGKVDPSQEEG